MANTDYSLDPYQTEEDNLLEQYARALRKSIQPTPAMNDPSARFYAAYDKAGADRDMGDIQNKRTQLSQRMMAALPDALRGDSAAKLAHPYTRQLEQEALKERQGMALDMEDRLARKNARSPMGPPEPGQSLPGAVAAAGGEDDAAAAMRRNIEDAGSVRPRNAAQGKFRAEMGKAAGQNGSIVLNTDTGRYEANQPAVQAVMAIDQGKEANTLVPYYDPKLKAEVKIPRWKYDQLMGNPMSNPEKGAVPSPLSRSVGAGVAPATAGPVSGPIRAVSEPPAVGAGVARAEGDMTMDLLLDGLHQVESSGGKHTYNKESGALGPYQFMPGTVAQLAKEGVVFNPMDPEQSRNAAKHLLKKYVDQTGSIEAGLAKYGGFVNKDPSEYIGKVLAASGLIGTANAQSAPTALSPQGTEAVDEGPRKYLGKPAYQEPTGAPGAPPNPMKQKLYEEAVMGEFKTNQKFKEALGNPQATLRTYGELMDLAKKPMYHGTTAEVEMMAKEVLNRFGGDEKRASASDQRYANTQQFVSLVKSLSGPLAQMYGYNPSNIDLKTALTQLPTLAQDPRTQQQVTQSLMRGLEYQSKSQEFIDTAVQDGYSIAQAQAAFKRHWDETHKGAAPPEPTASPGPSGPLAQSVGATQGKASPPPSDSPGINGGGYSALENAVQTLGEVPRNLVNAAHGFNDAWGNVARGGGRILSEAVSAMGGPDFYSGEDWKAEKARQDAMAQNSGYGGGKLTGEIASPLAAVPATTIPRVMALGASIGATQPKETISEQVIAAGEGAAVSGALGTLLKVIPVTEISAAVAKGSSALQDLAQKYGVRLTSAQANDVLASKIARGLGVNQARAGEQLGAVTKTLMKGAGIEGEALSTPAIAKADRVLSDGYRDVFSGSQKIQLDPGIKKQVVDGIEGLIDTGSRFTKASKTMQLYQLFTSPTAIKAVSPNGLHEVWKEIGQVAKDPQAAAQFRSALESMIEKGLSPAKLAEFRALNKKFGNLRDVERVWNSGTGGGQGQGAGYLKAESLKNEAGRGPFKGTATDEAAGLVEQFGIPEAGGGRVAIGSMTIPGMLAAGGRAVAGPITNWADRNLMGASPSTKFLLELLRKHGAQAGTGAELSYGSQ